MKKALFFIAVFACLVLPAFAQQTVVFQENDWEVTADETANVSLLAYKGTATSVHYPDRATVQNWCKKHLSVSTESFAPNWGEHMHYYTPETVKEVWIPADYYYDDFYDDFPDEVVFSSSLEAVHVAQKNTHYFSHEGVLYRRDSRYDGGVGLVRYPLQKKESQYTVYPGVKNVVIYNNFLQELVIPDSCNALVLNTPNLQTLHIPAKVRHIGGSYADIPQQTDYKTFKNPKNLTVSPQNPVYTVRNNKLALKLTTPKPKIKKGVLTWGKSTAKRYTITRSATKNGVTKTVKTTTKTSYKLPKTKQKPFYTVTAVDIAGHTLTSKPVRG